jgi:hypothetical protein
MRESKMGFFQFVGYSAGMMSNPITVVGILLIGAFSNKKKLSFGLGLLFGAVLVGWNVYTLRPYFPELIQNETYLFPMVF